MSDAYKERALEYHKYPTPGKIAIQATKPMATQQDLALAYSPGVAFPCEEIAADPSKALDYTSRGNLVAVITNGTAVLGLGAIGALASKPVMEGKSVLFKKFANIDSVDIEIDETDPEKLIEIIASLEPTFGGINLEDIKAPECFEIERRLRERMKIPVFHDDQHGTAIIVGAAIKNWLHYTKRKASEVKLVTSGAGASALACLNVLLQVGIKIENIIVTDRNGVVYKGRNEGMDPDKEKFAIDTKLRTLDEALKGANIFLGLSAAGVLDGEKIKVMAKDPLIMALANPTPEIMPDEARKSRPDAIICTGRSDYTNQVNNVLCFPFIFRGALDVGATTINEEMKMACVEAIAALARQPVTPEVAAIYSNETMVFGPEYLIPKPFDPRLIVELPAAVAKTAMETGVATRPITDFKAYKEKLNSFNVRTGVMMRPLFTKAKEKPKKVVYCEGEEERTLNAVQMVIDEGIARPVIIGRRAVVESRINRLQLRMAIDKDFDLVDPEHDSRFKDYWTSYHELTSRLGVTEALAQQTLRSNTTVIGSLLVRKGEADAMICGLVGKFRNHVKEIVKIIGLKPGVETAAALMILVLSKGTYFLCDTHVNPDPSISQLSEMTVLAAEEIKRYGMTPKAALLSHSNFGTHEDEAAFKMRAAYNDLRQRMPDLEIDGEMHADAALSEEIRNIVMPHSTLKGTANLLVMPNLDAANISYNMLKVLGDGIAIGPMLLGVAQPALVVTNSATIRNIVNSTALCVLSAQALSEDQPEIHRAQRAIRS